MLGDLMTHAALVFEKELERYIRPSPVLEVLNRFHIVQDFQWILGEVVSVIVVRLNDNKVENKCENKNHASPSKL